MSFGVKIKRQLLKAAFGRPLGRLVIDGALDEYGWIKSAQLMSSIDKNGNPLPWISYPSIDFLRKKHLQDLKVFEYGCGNGTKWWAARTEKVVACEHEKEWHDKIAPELPNNASVILCDYVKGGEYCNVIRGTGLYFDIIIVDGRDRVNCIKNCIDNLSDVGVIVLDNSDRPWYEEGRLFLSENSFREIAFVGMAPSIDYITSTSIFYRTNNCLGI